MSSARRVEITENSATMASTLNDNRPTGSVGSWTDAEVELDLSRAVSSATMSRASAQRGEKSAARRR
jgi:hypothetical protein